MGNVKFQQIGIAKKGIGQKTKKPYIRLELDPIMLKKVQDHDLSKIFLFETASGYDVMAVVDNNEGSNIPQSRLF